MDGARLQRRGCADERAAVPRKGCHRDGRCRIGGMRDFRPGACVHWHETLTHWRRVNWAVGAEACCAPCGQVLLAANKATASNRSAEKPWRSARPKGSTVLLKRQPFVSQIRWRVQKFKKAAAVESQAVCRRSSDYVLQKVVVNLSVENQEKRRCVDLVTSLFGDQAFESKARFPPQPRPRVPPSPFLQTPAKEKARVSLWYLL